MMYRIHLVPSIVRGGDTGNRQHRSLSRVSSEWGIWSHSVHGDCEGGAREAKDFSRRPVAFRWTSGEHSWRGFSAFGHGPTDEIGAGSGRARGGWFASGRASAGRQIRGA